MAGPPRIRVAVVGTGAIVTGGPYYDAMHGGHPDWAPAAGKEIA
ncbi:hypothetical protein GCM10009716_30300 [Streptomyces sodiiphilus]|uniref:Uncharacterized protein n=1 Tax=Streptomyces sodiiphilus TaxID=226217 RepID=A0ABN2PE78_9ACTN